MIYYAYNNPNNKVYLCFATAGSVYCLSLS